MSQLVRVGVAGTGSFAPPHVMTNNDFKEIETSDEWIRERTGIRERRIAQAGESTSHMAARACRGALEMAKVPAEEVDLIVCGTITPDNIFPSTACHLQHQLGCVKAGGMDVSAACSGFIYALSTGWAFVRAGLARNVLCVGAEKLSSITDFRDRTSCILFGDGAGAALLRPSDGPGEILFSSLHALGGHDAVMSVPGGGSRMPASHESVETRQHYMRLKGREVFKFAVTKMVEEIELCAAKCGVAVADLAMIVPHQVNLRILEYASEKLAYPLERMAINIDRYGNTSSASVPLALDEAVRAGRIKRGDLVVMVGFGAGLTWGSVALRW